VSGRDSTLKRGKPRYRLGQGDAEVRKGNDMVTRDRSCSAVAEIESTIVSYLWAENPLPVLSFPWAISVRLVLGFQ
jgi:hypothetical protein